MLACGCSARTDITFSSTSPVQHHVVAVDQLRVATVAENLREFTALAADDAARVLMVIGGKPAAELGTLAVPDHDGVAALEAPFYPGDAGWQQALAARERLGGASVHDDRAFGLERAGDPALPRRHGVGVGEEPRASAGTGKRRKRIEHFAARDRHMRAAGNGDLRGLDLRHHAAARQL